jgi:hypothetical protein
MPRKLTKHQRQYRKRTAEAKKDFIRVKKDGSWDGVRVARRRLKVWVSKSAFDRLGMLARAAGIHNWEMLSRMVLKGLPRYASLSDSLSPVKRYSWDESLLHPAERIVRYKGDKGEKQISYDITSTAWKKLECHKTVSRLSKARIVQSLILNYKPLTPDQLERQRWLTEASARERDEWIEAIPHYREYKHSHLLDTGGGVIIHKKGIPIEYWDEAEMAEFEKLQLKSAERRLEELRLHERQDTDEYRFFLRMKEQLGNLWSTSF